MATYDKLIQVKNLKKYYNGDKIKALDGVSVDINKGDRLCQFRIVENQPHVYFDEVETLGNPDRGGWGSTGAN